MGNVTFLQCVYGASQSLLLVVATLLPIVNPLSTAPIFMSMCEGASAATRRQMARQVGRNVFMLMLGCMLVGSFVLELFGISLSIVGVGGGLLVVNMGWRLLNADSSTNEHKERIAEDFPPERVRNMVFFPLAFPIAVGPGTLAACITLAANLRNTESWVLQLSRLLGAISGLALVATLIYLCYRYAYGLLRALGESGVVVFLRLSAFILMCLGLQIIWNGLVPLIQGVMTAGAGVAPVP